MQGLCLYQITHEKMNLKRQVLLIAHAHLLMPRLCEYTRACTRLQVWVSSAWSRATLTAFRSALTALLTSPDTSMIDEAVLRVLRSWQRLDVPLKTARKGGTCVMWNVSCTARDA